MKKDFRVDLKSPTLEALDMIDAALADASRMGVRTEASEQQIASAQASVKKIKELIASAEDSGSHSAAALANAVVEQLCHAALDYLAGNYSSADAIKAAEHALAAAAEWSSLVPKWWFRAAKAADAARLSELPGEIKLAAARYRLSTTAEDVSTIIKNRMERLQERRKTDRAELNALRTERDSLENEKERIMAEYKSAAIDVSEAKESVLNVQRKIAGIEEHIEALEYRIDKEEILFDDVYPILEELFYLAESMNIYKIAFDSEYLMGIYVGGRKWRDDYQSLTELHQILLRVREMIIAGNGDKATLCALIVRIKEILEVSDPLWRSGRGEDAPRGGSQGFGGAQDDPFHRNGTCYGSPMTPKAGVLPAGTDTAGNTEDNN